MIKQSSNSKAIILMLILSVTSFLFVTCSKRTVDIIQTEEVLSTKFFSYQIINDNDIKSIANQIKQKNEKEHFLSTFIRSKGYILWNKAEKSNSSTGLLAILPFAFENGKEINGFIIDRQDFQLHQTSFDVFTKDNLSQYDFNKKGSKLNVQKVQSIVNYFNLKNYNITTFKIQDIRQLPDTFHNNPLIQAEKNKIFGKFKINQLNQSDLNSVTINSFSNGGGCFSYWEETEWWWNPDGGAANNNGDEYYEYST
jgi:hypothetical protein